MRINNFVSNIRIKKGAHRMKGRGAGQKRKREGKESLDARGGGKKMRDANCDEYALRFGDNSLKFPFNSTRCNL